MSLTPAERQALEAVAEHETVKEAAVHLGKSPRTIEKQLETARKRLNVSTTIAAYRRSRDT